MSEDPREALLDVARDIVARRGYVGLTMRTASAAVGVTPEVARRYYRNREALFAAAMRLPADPVSAIPTLMAPGIEGMGERLVRFTLDTLRDPEARNDLMSLARTGVSAGHAVTVLQDFVEVDVVDRIATIIGVPDARMRSALITSYLLGVATMRYGVRLEPLASASDEEVIRMVAPVIQDLLDPRKPIPGSARARGEHSTARPEDLATEPPSAAAAKRTFDPDPAATRAKQAALLAAAAKEHAAERASATERSAPRPRPAAKAPAAANKPAAPRAKSTAKKPASTRATAKPTAKKPASTRATAKPNAEEPTSRRSPTTKRPAEKSPATRPAAEKPPAEKRPAERSAADNYAQSESTPQQPGAQGPDIEASVRPPTAQRYGSTPESKPDAPPRAEPEAGTSP